MRRYVTAMLLVAIVAPLATAQTRPMAPPPTTPTPTPIAIPITSARPPTGYYKSGGVLVGSDGYYPFDTGAYLLGGYDGLTRSTGTFYMVPPATAFGPPAPVVVESAAPVYATGRGRLFHKR